MRLRVALAAAIALVAGLVAAPPAYAHDAISFDAPSFTVTEGDGARAVIVIRRCCHETTATSVRFTMEPGTAEPGVDYTPVDRTLSFTSGQEPAEVEVPILNDDVAEAPETVNLVLSEPGAGSILGYPRSAVLTIVDDDGPSRVSFAPVAFEHFEHRASLALSVIRSGDRTSAATVGYATEDPPGTGEFAPAASGVDYEAATGTVSFAAGSAIRVQRFSVRLIDDKLAEGDESFLVRLGAPTGAELADPSFVEAIIRDDESAMSADTEAPLSAFHYPLDGKTYRRGGFRDLLVFNQDDEGGSGVKNVHVAIVKRLRSGKCAWWTGSAFKRRACRKELWVKKRSTSELVVFTLPRRFEVSTGGSRVKRYVAFSKAIDLVGNEQWGFQLGQNKVRFDIR